MKLCRRNGVSTKGAFLRFSIWSESSLCDINKRWGHCSKELVHDAGASGQAGGYCPLFVGGSDYSGQCGKGEHGDFCMVDESGTAGESDSKKEMSEFTLLDRQQLDALLDQAKERLFPFGVGFLKLGPGSDAVPALAGSGTLAVVNGIHGIVTADHVLRHLPPTGRVGLLSGYASAPTNRFKIEMDTTQSVVVGRPSGEYGSGGPDLGFLILSPDTVATLKARASFYEITGRRDRMLSSPPAIESGGWVILGVIEEWTSEGPGEINFPRVKHFESVCGGSMVSREEHRDGFDYLYFEVRSGEPEEHRPASFAGASGGSLWQIVARLEGGAASIKEVLLSGVPFYQSEIRNGHRTIVCHGRRSIYDLLVNAVRSGA